MENKSYWEWNLKVKKVNKTRKLFGYVLVKTPIDNNIFVQVKILKQQGGEYRYTPFAIRKEPICQLCQRDNYAYPEVAKNSDFPADAEKNCPFQPVSAKFWYKNNFND